MSRARIAGACAVLLSVVPFAGGCGAGPTGEPKTEASGAKKAVAECPARPAPADPAPGRMSAALGKRVAKMCLYGVDGDERVTAQKTLRTREGDTLDAERVREDIGALIKLGTVDDLAVSAIPFGDDVVVLYQLKMRPRIAEVTFEGAHVFEKEGLTGKVAMEKQRPLVPSELHDLLAAMREEYARRGYRTAKIEAKTENAGPNLVRLKFVVVEGPQWKFGKVAFKGATKVPDAELRKATADLKEGAAFDEEKVERAAMQISALYFDRGMVNARVTRTNGDPDKDGAAPITFTVEEGDVFRIGAIKLEKLAAADEKTLLAKLKTKPKQVFSRTQLVDDVKTLTDTFAARGQKVQVFPRTDVDTKKKTVDVALDVEAAP